MKISFSFFPGQSLVLIGLAGVILCFLPIFCQWDSDYNVYSRADSPIMDSLHSLRFRYSLVASIAISVPLLLNYIIDFSCTKEFEWDLRNAVRLVILLGLIIPDILILLCADQANSPEMLDSIYHSRGIVGFCTILLHLYNFGSPIFNSNLVFLGGIITVLGGVLSCLSPFLTSEMFVFYYIYHSIFAIDAVIGFYLSYKWFKYLSMTTNQYKNMTNDQYTISSYLLSLALAGIGLVILSIIYGRPISFKTSANFLMLSTYLQILITVNISLFEGRLTMHNIYVTKVNYLFILFLNLFF